ncbi:hypothetical protein [Paeniglutamicibacter terrestris]|uniref:Uncharacterized protein n=1 Tax=Paeniglutamicibacter terrestris TaxID=2723403 RepID=A0ABX1G141_9MICC|nr:hypothetical protein [Paeniglutamicibacter terrestris]NKG19325.1 hypothetical protein [Paeniglutamicibacter terrestris]
MSTHLTAATWSTVRMASETRVTRLPRAMVFVRLLAVLAALMSVLHLWLLLLFPHGLWVGTLFGIMVLICLKCAHRVWDHPVALTQLLVMSALMAITHTFMALGVHDHHHGSGGVAAAGSGAAAMLGVAAAELVLVMLCSLGLRISRASKASTDYSPR